MRISDWSTDVCSADLEAAAARPGQESLPQAPRTGFAPKVIRGGFSSSIPGAMAANDSEALQLPLYGRIAAGTPIEALRDHSNYVDVPAAIMGSGEHYALEVDGDSMIDAGILDGDTVVIERCDTAENGTIVVALIDNEEATLKRLRRKEIGRASCRERVCQYV